jgi:predicted nuclease with RNAse H fold
MKRRSQKAIVVGVDVGSIAKGFHAVALAREEYFDQMASCDPDEVAAWCRDRGALAVGIDAPIDWSRSGKARSAERELMASKISCFATPREEVARSHPTNYFGWMLNGARLYRAMEAHFRRFDGTSSFSNAVCFETFPQAVACSLAGRVIAAKNKGVARRALLKSAGVSTELLRSIDAIDAALCALAAACLVRNEYKTYGDLSEGFIVVPR